MRALDPRVALEVPSATPLDAEGRVRLALGAELGIDAKVTTKPLSIADNPIPGVTAEASLTRGVWKGSAHVDETGAPTNATFTFDKGEGLKFEVESSAASLRAVKRLGAPIDGSARVKVAGTLKDGALDAKVSGRVGAIRVPGDVALEDGTIDARVRGPVASPTVDASVRGNGVRAGRYAWETIEVRATGPALGLHVETKLDGGGESIAASGALDAKAKAVRDVKLAVRRREGAVEGTVKQVSATPRGVVVDQLALHGDAVGELRGGLTVQGKEIVGKLHGRDVDLGKVAKMAGLTQRLAGLANVDVDLSSSRPGSRRGHVSLEMVNGEASGVSGLSGLISATFEGERVRVDGLVRLVAHASPREPADERCDGAIAAVRLSGGDGLLAGPLLDPDTWARASGRVEVAAEDWNLRCIARLAPVDLVLSEVRGKLTTRAVIERRPGWKLPSVKGFMARTRGLEVAGPMNFGAEKPEWESRSVDLEVRGSFDPASGVAGAKVTVMDGSPIASVGARATLDIPAFLDHPERRFELLRGAPIEVNVSVPRRAVGAFGTLPSFVRERLPPLAGEVELKGSVTGSIDHPRIDVRADAWGLAHVLPMPPEPPPDKRKPGKSTVPLAPPESPWALPLDVAVTLGYDGAKATASAHVKRDDQSVADAQAEFAVAIADVLAGRPIKPKGSAEAKLTSLQLGDIPFFSDRGIEGHLSGNVTLTGLGEAPALKVAVTLPDLKVGHDLAYDDVSLALDIGRPKGRDLPADRGTATARVEIASKTGGKLSASAFSDIVWQNALVPTIDPGKPADLVAKATRFRLAVLGPFLAGVLSRVDGTLDGDARLGWTRLDDDDKARIAVRMKLTGGVFHVPQLGQELRNAELELSGGNGGVLVLDRLRADGAKGRLNGSGSARFAGLRFQRADAHFEIKSGQELPITLEGVPMGDARGKVDIVAEKKDRDLSVTVGIPRLHIDLPKSSGNSVQALDDNPDIEIVQDRGKPHEAPVKDGSRLSLTVNLGEITVKGNNLDVSLAGVKSAPIKVEMVDQARVSGDIQLTRGRVEVMKKQFEIEQGFVHLRPEDSANPYVNVTARWDSPEGPIYIEYAGVLLPIAPEKIKYRSPNIPEDRIMATLLFGGVEQSTLGAGAGTSGAAGVPGSALAAQLIAQQFSTQIAGNISTSIGTNDDGTFRPGLVYNTGDKVIELSTYGATGQAGSGSSSSTLKGQRTLITVDWRFWRNWMLRGRVDAGSDQTVTGMDVLWQYRY
ncbi:MAG: translocation/assembly module TamB domain-containing protein [Minicystis sp.]